jgi:dihydrofolate reductase
MTLDGYANNTDPHTWGGYWSKHGPEWLEHRSATYAEDQRMVFGARTFAMFAMVLGSTAFGEPDAWATRMRELPTTVLSSTLAGLPDWPDAVVEQGDAVDVVARLKDESDVPLRSHGSLSLNQALLAAGLVDQVQVTIFPVINGATGAQPVFEGVPDFDLDLVASHTFDGHTQELIYRPHLRYWKGRYRPAVQLRRHQLGRGLPRWASRTSDASPAEPEPADPCDEGGGRDRAHDQRWGHRPVVAAPSQTPRALPRQDRPVRLAREHRAA